MEDNRSIFFSFRKLSQLGQSVAFFAALLLIFSLLPLVGFQIYEPASDPSFIAVFKGVFSNAHGRLSNNDGNWIFLQYVLRFFYIHFPTADWYGIFMIFFCSLSSFIYLKIAKREIALCNSAEQKVFKAVLLACIYLLFFVTIGILEFTRVAALLAFSGLLLIVYLLKSGNSISLGEYFLGLFAFLMGCFVRNQPALLSTLLIIPVLLVFIVRGLISVKRAMKYLALPAFFLFLTAAFSSVGWDKSWDKTLEYGGYLINIWDFNLSKDKLAIASTADSLTYKIVSEDHFINDPPNINPQFFERIKVPYTDKKVLSAFSILSNKIDHLRKFKENGIGFINRHVGGVLLFICVSFLALFHSRNGKIGFQLAAAILFIFFTGLYFFIATFLKMEDRVICPLLFSFTLSIALLIDIRNFEYDKLKILYLIGVPFLVCFSALEFKQFSERFTKLKADTVNATAILKYLSRREEKNIFLEQLTMRCYSYPLQADPLPANRNYPTIDNIAFFIDPTYDRKMKEITGGNNLKQYLDYAATHSDECLFVTDANRLSRILNYCNYMYNMKLRVEPVISDFETTGNREIEGLKYSLVKISY